MFRLFKRNRQVGLSGRKPGHPVSGSPSEGVQGSGVHQDREAEGKREPEINSAARLSNDIALELARSYLTPNDDILEIGCGAGVCSEKLRMLGRHLICADESPRMIDLARRRLEGATNVFFERLNGFDLRQFGDASFHFLFSFHHFLKIDMESSYSHLREFRRVLKPNGRGVVRFANINSDWGWREFADAASDRPEDESKKGRIRFLTWEIIESFLTRLNLQVLNPEREFGRDILVAFEKKRASASSFSI
jgi:SAM-dependent methyltransferase